MPCLMSTNDELFTVLGNKRFDKESVKAALRRLYIIPIKQGKYETLHNDELFRHEEKILCRIFNFLVGFSLYQ